ncbi:uncharacterized protein B0H64DRAFT_330430 [Chaetomium fimeti]|uniref:Uncharacterized protein n=1 Tax=Chaetomium fimeti TaxID=1854472 RepID=A0AAE0LNJ9_9PEZI|nr:hypothetical protein B0H64DRAFT_330430 [Chaetomium fimeti]
MAAPERRLGLDIERSACLPEETAVPPPPALPSHTQDPLYKSGTVCFVCLDSPRDGQYVVKVKCLKPKRKRKIIQWTLETTHSESLSETSSDTPSHSSESRTVRMRKETAIYERRQPWDTVLEDDRKVYIRMLEACFQHLGKWRKWLPFYGVVSVTEFQFDGRISRGGRFSGLMIPVDIDKIIKDCEQAIEMEPMPGDHNGWDSCYNGHHATDCKNKMEWDQKCLTVSAEKANERLRRIPLHYLFTLCARNPTDANGLDTLSGMTQGSCIYSTL